MAEDGEWKVDMASGSRTATLRLGPVFFAEVVPPERTPEGQWWKATLNGQLLGEFNGEAAARSRIEWEIANRIRLMRPGWDRMRARGIPKSGGGGRG